MKNRPTSDCLMTFINIVIHLLFTRAVRLLVAREMEDKITWWYRQEKSSSGCGNNKNLNLL